MKVRSVLCASAQMDNTWPPGEQTSWSRCGYGDMVREGEKVGGEKEGGRTELKERKRGLEW